ncbi:MAG: methyltransferase domain-containing protein, partial [Proteobacteria bacterium]|nr:methyltransferase domain-containing protein [Pseudomonadota bacterium]
ATALTEETTLPLAENSIDRILLVHTLENTQHLKALLEESWRVLAGSGRMVVVVPHRGGFWNMSSKIPFGSGFSFSHGHIRRLLADNRFQVERHARALFVPPFLYRLLGPSAEWIERNGARFLPALAGVLLVEVSKQVYAKPSMQKVRTAKPVLIPLPDFVAPSPTAGRTR